MTWTVANSTRIFTIAAAAAVTAYNFVVAGPLAGFVTLVVAALAVWLFVFRPALTLTGTDLVVRNPWGTRRVPLADITGTGGAYTGLRIERRSGTPVTAWAVQKSNAAKWSGTSTRADQVATEIMAAARRS